MSYFISPRAFMVVFVATTVTIFSCGGNSTGNNPPVKTSSASDTITNITNPGVGSVADDTARAR